MKIEKVCGVAYSRSRWVTTMRNPTSHTTTSRWHRRAATCSKVIFNQHSSLSCHRVILDDDAMHQPASKTFFDYDVIPRPYLDDPASFIIRIRFKLLELHSSSCLRISHSRCTARSFTTQPSSPPSRACEIQNTPAKRKQNLTLRKVDDLPPARWSISLAHANTPHSRLSFSPTVAGNFNAGDDRHSLYKLR